MRFLNISTLFVLCLSLTSCERSNNYGPVVEETYVHRYGVVVPQEDWTTRGQSGKVITTLKNGVIMTKSLTNGILDGETTYSFPHSEIIQTVETYAQGNFEKSIIYYRSGKPSREVIVEGPETQVITRWYENGAPQAKERVVNGALVSGDYFTSKNQIEGKVVNGQGTRIQRDIYGQLLSTDTMENGYMALCATCHSTGAPKELIPYKNAVVDGQLKTFLPGGEPNTIETWVNGNKEGITIVFQDGEKYAEVPYSAGIKHGIEKRFRDGDHLVEEISWVNDQRHGQSFIYIGEATTSEWHYQDRLVTAKTFDLLNRGKPIN